MDYPQVSSSRRHILANVGICPVITLNHTFISHPTICWLFIKDIEAHRGKLTFRFFLVCVFYLTFTLNCVCIYFCLCFVFLAPFPSISLGM